MGALPPMHYGDRPMRPLIFSSVVLLVVGPATSSAATFHVTTTGDDGASGVASCTSGTYSGPDGGDVTVSGSCTDNAGNTGSTSLKIKYDATAPAVTGTPSRKPDANGWYNHAVDVAFTGTDAGSGVKECSPTVTYKGPDASPAKWHRAHTTWFFEQFLLGEHCAGYAPFHPDYAYLFNSYYVSAGPRHARAQAECRKFAMIISTPA